jgi:hypothetical protein
MAYNTTELSSIKQPPDRPYKGKAPSTLGRPLVTPLVGPMLTPPANRDFRATDWGEEGKGWR